MTNQDAKEILSIIGDAHSDLMIYLEKELPDIGVIWSDEAFISYEPKNDAFYVSLTEEDEDEHKRWLSWRVFIEIHKNCDPDVTEGLIKKMESGIKELKAHQSRFD